MTAVVPGKVGPLAGGGRVAAASCARNGVACHGVPAAACPGRGRRPSPGGGFIYTLALREIPRLGASGTHFCQSQRVILSNIL